MPSNENVVSNSILQAAAPDLVEVDYNDFEQLKIAANQFIAKVENMINQVRHTHQLIQSKTSIKNSLTVFYQLMRQSTQFTQEALILQHAFETQLNNFLGRKIYLGWVNDEGHILYFDQADIGRLYTNATANRGRGNISASTMKNMMDVNDLTDDLQKKLQQSEKLRAHVYNIAIARWSGNENNEIIKNYDPSKKTFYWRLFDNHHISGWTKPIQTKGIIAEGYAGAVINEDPNVVSSNLEYSLKVLYENHIQKDSVGAAIKGDVVWNENGNIQFAIKAGSFSTARFGQYLNLAYNTIQIKMISANEYEKYLPKLIRISKVTDSILTDINQKSEQILNQTIKEVAPLI